jgi:hypothetical protein
VLANPPYVRKENIPAAVKPTLLENYGDAITGRSDLYCSFYARGVELLRDGGMHVFVCSNSWLDAGYGADLQRFLLKHCRVLRVVDSAVEKQFSTANVNTIVSVLQRAKQIGNPICVFSLLRGPFDLAIENNGLRTDVAIAQDALRAGGESDGAYVGDKWGGKYLRAPESYKLVFGAHADRFAPLSSLATIDGYIHDNNTGDDYTKQPVLWTVKDASTIRITPQSDCVQRIGVKPSGNSRQLAPILFPRTFGTRHLVLWCVEPTLGKEFYKITPHDAQSVASIVMQLNSTLGVLQREILGIKGLGGGAIKFAAADVGQYLIAPNLCLDPTDRLVRMFAKRPILDFPMELSQGDRRELDAVIFDHLGVSQEIRERVYEETEELVEARRGKARSVLRPYTVRNR